MWYFRRCFWCSIGFSMSKRFKIALVGFLYWCVNVCYYSIVTPETERQNVHMATAYFVLASPAEQVFEIEA